MSQFPLQRPDVANAKVTLSYEALIELGARFATRLGAPEGNRSDDVLMAAASQLAAKHIHDPKWLNFLDAVAKAVAQQKALRCKVSSIPEEVIELIMEGSEQKRRIT